MKDAGVSLGVGSLVVAFRRLVSTPSLWPYALLPSITLGLVLTLALVFGASPLVARAVQQSGLANLDTWYGHALQFAWSAVLWLTSALAAVWLALLVTPPLCAPALERLVRSEEELVGATPRKNQSFWSELSCGVRAQFAGLLFTFVAWTLLTALNFAAPTLLVVTLPLKVASVSAALAWSLLDYPLTLRGIGIKQRLRLFLARPLTVLGFGLPFALLFWLPCASVFLLPVGAMAATRVVWSLARNDRQWRAALADANLTSTR